LLTARTERFEVIEAEHQFGGFGGVIGGGVGFAIPAFGSTGFATGGFGGGAPAGIPGPILTLESAFGTGFTSADIADQIRAAEQGGRFSSGEPGITITTGPTGLVLVLNLANALFEIFDSSGRKLGGGATPEAALEAVRAGGGVPAGGGGGTEPLPFPRRSPQSRPLPLSHLRRRPLRSLLPRLWQLSCHLWASCFGAVTTLSERPYLRRPSSRPSRRSRRQISRPLSRLLRREYDLEVRLMCQSSSDRRAIPLEYVVRLFQAKNNSPERSRSGNSSQTCLGFGRRGRTQTNNGEHLNSS